MPEYNRRVYNPLAVPPPVSHPTTHTVMADDLPGPLATGRVPRGAPPSKLDSQQGAVMIKARLDTDAFALREYQERRSSAGSSRYPMGQPSDRNIRANDLVFSTIRRRAARRGTHGVDLTPLTRGWSSFNGFDRKKGCPRVVGVSNSSTDADHKVTGHAQTGLSVIVAGTTTLVNTGRYHIHDGDKVMWELPHVLVTKGGRVTPAYEDETARGRFVATVVPFEPADEDSTEAVGVKLDDTAALKELYDCESKTALYRGNSLKRARTQAAPSDDDLKAFAIRLHNSRCIGTALTSAAPGHPFCILLQPTMMM